MRKTTLALALAAGLLPFAAAPQASAQYCEGTVRGLSATYNPATGSGFLAVRSKPKKSSAQLGELFNGDKVEIFKRQGNWYLIATTDPSAPMLEGWAHFRWINNDCNY